MDESARTRIIFFGIIGTAVLIAAVLAFGNSGEERFVYYQF